MCRVEESLDTQLSIAEVPWPRCAAGTGGAAPAPPLRPTGAQVPSLGPDCREVISGRASLSCFFAQGRKESRKEERVRSF